MAAAGPVPPAPVPARPVVREAVSAQELAQGYLSEEKLARLVGGWHEHGLAILESVIPTSDLDRLAVRMDFDTAHQYVARKDKSSLPNRGDGPMAGATPGQHASFDRDVGARGQPGWGAGFRWQETGCADHPPD